MSPHLYRELSQLSPGYARLRGRLPMCYAPVCHGSNPFDLHALDTPPAFILSQDQTLKKFLSLTKENNIENLDFSRLILFYLKSWLS
jgi:hypothetical protein